MDINQALANIFQSFGIGLAYFLGSQQELGARLLEDSLRETERAALIKAAKPDSDLDLGVVFLHHIDDDRERGERREQLFPLLLPLFYPLRLHLLFLEEENPHVQYAALKGVLIYRSSEKFEKQYRRQVLTLYGDWHSWW